MLEKAPFLILYKFSVPMKIHPSCTFDPSVGVVYVPDSRIEAVPKFSNSKKN